MELIGQIEGKDVLVLELRATSLDASNVREFRDTVQTLMADKTRVVFDMGGVSFVDSSGLGALISCLRQVNGRKGDFRLCAMSKSVRALFELMRMPRVFNIYESRADAIRSLFWARTDHALARPRPPVRLLELFDAVVVLDDASGAAHPAIDALLAADSVPVVLDLSSPPRWRAALAALLDPRGDRLANGVLVLAPLAGDLKELRRSHDRMVERLEQLPWEIAFLGHGDGRPDDATARGADFIHCDSVPSGLCAVAVRAPLLRTLLDAMPDRAVDAPLTPREWLTILSWLAQPPVRRSRALSAWPSLLRPLGDASPPAAGH